MSQEVLSQCDKRLPNHIALGDHGILEKSNVDRVSSDDIAVIREESSSLHRKLDAMNHDIRYMKSEMNKLKSMSWVPRDVGCLKHEVRLLKCANAVPRGHLRGEIASISECPSVIQDNSKYISHLTKFLTISGFCISHHFMKKREKSDYIDLVISFTRLTSLKIQSNGQKSKLLQSQHLPQF
jgi:hypothetical protein